MRRSIAIFALSALASAAALGHGGAGEEQVTPIAAAQLPAQAGSHAQALRVEFAPGQISTPHRHPGPVLVVVVSGEVESALDNQPPQRFKAGDAWYEAPGQVHRVARNPSASQPAVLVAWLLSDGRSPLVKPVPH